MFNRMDNMFDQAFAQPPDDDESTTSNQPLRRRKTLSQQIIFWSTNAVVLPLVAICYLTISAEGLRQMMPVFATRLYKTAIPGAGLLRHYDGWDRLDLSMLMALILFGAVTFIWVRVFMVLFDYEKLKVWQSKNPILFYMLTAIVGIVVLGDCVIFFYGLESKAASSWGNTPDAIPVIATILYIAGLALIGAWHADYHNSGIV